MTVTINIRMTWMRNLKWCESDATTSIKFLDSRSRAPQFIVDDVVVNGGADTNAARGVGTVCDDVVKRSQTQVHTHTRYYTVREIFSLFELSGCSQIEIVF